jgi:hypothetical protein
MKVHLTLKSANKKTGKIPVSTTEEDSCPRSCPWFEKGCYANSGPLRLHWKHVSNGDRSTSFKTFLEKIRALPAGQLWRHNQAGDLPGSGEYIRSNDLAALWSASKHTRGFTYTHKPVLGESVRNRRNASLIKKWNSSSFTINLSGNGIDHADQLKALDIAPVTTVLLSSEVRKSFLSPAGNRIVTCPAAINDSVSCSTCKLCANPNRKTLIGFPAHGSGLKVINDYNRESKT